MIQKNFFFRNDKHKLIQSNQKTRSTCFFGGITYLFSVLPQWCSLSEALTFIIRRVDADRMKNSWAEWWIKVSSLFKRTPIYLYLLDETIFRWLLYCISKFTSKLTFYIHKFYDKKTVKKIQNSNIHKNLGIGSPWPETSAVFFFKEKKKIFFLNTIEGTISFQLRPILLNIAYFRQKNDVAK